VDEILVWRGAGLAGDTIGELSTLTLITLAAAAQRAALRRCQTLRPPAPVR